MDTEHFKEAIQNIADNSVEYSRNAIAFNNGDNKAEVVRMALKR